MPALSLRKVLAIVMLAAIAAFTSCATKTDAPLLKTQRTVLCALDGKARGVTVSPDGKHVAYLQMSGTDKAAVVLDGVAGKLYNYEDPAIRPSRESLPPTDEIFSHSLTFSPDSNRLAYSVVQDGEIFVVIDGVEGKRYGTGYANWGLIPVFSPDSAHYAYLVSGNNKSFLVRDGVEGKRWDGKILLGAQESPRVIPRFSPDSQDLAYFAATRSGFVLVVDGMESPAEDYYPIGEIHFAAPGKCQFSIYKGWEQHRGNIVLVEATLVTTPKPMLSVKATIVRRVENAVSNRFTVSADGQHVAYITPREGKYIAVFDGAEGKPYDDIMPWTMRISPDGKRIAYIVKQGGKPTVSKEVALSDRHQYFATDGGAQMLVVDGVENKTYDAVDIISLRFSPDGAHYAYVARKGGECLVVRDGVETLSLSNGNIWFDALTVGEPYLIFSPDSKHLAYIISGNGTYMLALDGAVSAPFAEVAGGARIDFSTPGKCGLYVIQQSASGQKSVIILEATAPATEQK